MRTFVSLSVLALLGLAATCAWPADNGDVLHKCTAIDSPGERLACYDKLAGRVSHPVPTPPSDKPLGKESFGLYSAEHPAAPQGYPELTAAVTKVGPGPNGDMLISLQGGQLWRITDADPLLAKDDTVNIKRGKLGSFLLTTPSGRIHRAYRLK